MIFLANNEKKFFLFQHNGSYESPQPKNANNLARNKQQVNQTQKNSTQFLFYYHNFSEKNNIFVLLRNCE